jgi:hypothetical protein
MSDLKEYRGPIVRGYRYRIVGSGREWFGEVDGVSQVASVRARSKYAVKSLLRRGVRKYIWQCDAYKIVPKCSCAENELLSFRDRDGVYSEEMVSLYNIYYEHGVVFTDLIWLFSNENFVIKRKTLGRFVLNAKTVGCGRLTLLIDISRFGGECSILLQPYPDFFSVSIDNVLGVMEVRFFEVDGHKDRYCFNVNVETPSGLKVDAVNIFRSDDGKNSVFYGHTTLSKEYFFSFNMGVFEFFRSAFGIPEIFCGSDIKGAAICAHAFVNAVVGRVYFSDLRMGPFLRECCEEASLYLQDFYFITKYEIGINRMFRWARVNHLREILQWFDSSEMHKVECYKNIICELWKSARGGGSVLNMIIVEIVAMRYENRRNSDIYDRVMRMLAKYGKYGIDANVELKFKCGSNISQKISNVINSSPVRSFVDSNLFPHPLGDKRAQ